MYDWLTFYSQVFDEGAVNMWQEYFMCLDNEYTLLYCVFRASVVITFYTVLQGGKLLMNLLIPAIRMCL